MKRNEFVLKHEDGDKIAKLGVNAWRNLEKNTGYKALVYAGLMAYDQEQGNQIDYNVYKVRDWMDGMDAEGFKRLVEVIGEATRVPVSGKK